jgi:hypothetical protein
MIRIKSSEELREAYEYVKNNKDKYDTVGIDSFTDIAEIVLSELNKDAYYGDAKNSMVKWGKLADTTTAIAKSFRDLKGLNVIILALPESVQNGFEEIIVPMMPGKKTKNKLASLYDIVALIRVDENGERCFITGMTESFTGKDRSDKLDPVEPYTKEHGIKPLIDKIVGA